MLAEVSLHQLIKLLVDWNIDWLNDSLIIERFLFTEKYPHDSEQSIQTLSYMIGDQDCALMVARRLPRCWPRILALATTLGPEVSRNTVAILSGVKNVSYTWEFLTEGICHLITWRTGKRRGGGGERGQARRRREE